MSESSKIIKDKYLTLVHNTIIMEYWLKIKAKPKFARRKVLEAILTSLRTVFSLYHRQFLSNHIKVAHKDSPLMDRVRMDMTSH